MTEYLSYYIEDNVVKNKNLHNFRIRCLTPEDAEYCRNQLNVGRLWASYYFKEIEKLKQENEKLEEENFMLGLSLFVVIGFILLIIYWLFKIINVI